MIKHIHDYVSAVSTLYQRGNIETSFNPSIIKILEQFGCIAVDMSGKRDGKKGENIDIELWRENEDITTTEPFAGVEVKKVGGIDSRAMENVTIEAARYGSVILTDNLKWEFWRAGDNKMYAGVRLIEPKDGKFILREENVELLVSLLENFMLRDPVSIRSSGKLAEYMAIHAKTIRNVIMGILKEDEDEQPLINDRQKGLRMFSQLLALYSKIKEELRPLLTTKKFADMYAQTIVYGLFIARYNDDSPENFNRFEAIGNLQEESALLNRFFTHIASSGEIHQTLDKVINDLCTLYQRCFIPENHVAGCNGHAKRKR